jgi:hypothetical protein
MKNIFKKEVAVGVINRINNLTAISEPVWGKMNVGQMLAHCNVTYEMIYDNIHPKPNGVKKWILRLLVKNIVVSDKPYKKNSPTASQFLIKDIKEFETEKNRLINYIIRTQELGENHFDHKESHSFGPLNKNEWNQLFYKHLDHHLQQFGV